MALINTKKSSLFLKSGAALPLVPSNFLEVTEEITLNIQFPSEEYKRINGLLGSNDSFVDTCHATISQSISTKARHSNGAGDALGTPPEYGELLKIGGFDEIIDTTTAGEETVTYSNTQAPIKGSIVAFLDGNKQTMTDSVVADITINLPIGKCPTVDANISAFVDNDGISTAEANPTVTLNNESVMLVTCTDIFTAAGVNLIPDNISISVSPEMPEFYGMGRKEFAIKDYNIKVTADFYPDNAAYNSAIEKLQVSTIEALSMKIGTQNGVLVNGKSILITCDTAKAITTSDSTDNSTLKRSFTWQLVGKNQISIKHGFFA